MLTVKSLASLKLLFIKCYSSFLFYSEKEDEESEKREEPGDNWEETGGGIDRSSGPWNKSAPAPAPVVEPIGKFNSRVVAFSNWKYVSLNYAAQRGELKEQFLCRHLPTYR